MDVCFFIFKDAFALFAHFIDLHTHFIKLHMRVLLLEEICYILQTSRILIRCLMLKFKPCKALLCVFSL